MKLRKAGRWILGGTGVLALLVVLLYLLRWPLFGGLVRAEFARLAGEHLKADVSSIRSLGGSLIGSIEAEGVVLEPRAGSPIRAAAVRTIAVRYGFLGRGPLEIDVTGVEVALASKPGPAPPAHQTVREALPVLRSIRFAGKVRARDSVLVLGDGRRLEVAEATLEEAHWTARFRTEGFGEVRGSASDTQGELAIEARMGEGPVPFARIELGPPEGRIQTLKVRGEYAGHGILWEGKATLDAGGVIERAEGKLKVPQGYAKTSVDLVAGRGRLDVDGTIPVREPVQADVELKGVAEGPLTGPLGAWTFSDVTAKTRNAVYKSLKVDFAEASCTKGTLAGLPLRAGFSAGKDHAEVEGIVRWKDSPDFELSGRAEAEDVAPYLLLLAEPPPLKAAKVRAQGKLAVAAGRVSFEGRVESGPGSFDGRGWKSLEIVGAYSPEKIEAREILVRDTALGPVVTGNGTLEGDRLDADLKGGPDHVTVKGRAPKSGGFDGEFSITGPCLWLNKAFEVELPEWALPLEVTGRGVGAGGTTSATLKIFAGKQRLTASPEFVAREKEGTWTVEVSPGVIELPDRRRLEHGRFTIEAKAGRVAVPDLKLALNEPAVSARVAASVKWDAREMGVELMARELEALGIKLESIHGEARADRLSEIASVELRWGKEGGPSFEASGQLGRENDFRVLASAPDLRDPFVRKLLGDLALEGGVSADLHVYGTLDRPDATGTVSIRGITTAGLRPLSLVVPVRTEEGSALRLWTEESTPYGKLAIDGRLTLPWIEPKTRVDFSATLETGDLLPMLDRVDESAKKWIPAGRLTAAATLRGPVATPVWKVEAQFQSERFKPPAPLGLATGLRASVRFDSSGVIVESVDGALGGGAFHGQGLWEIWEKERPLRLHVTGDDVLVVEDELARIRIKPDVTLRYTATNNKLWLEGSVEVPFALYHREFGSPALGSPERKAPALPIEARAPRLRLIPLPEGGFRIPGIEGLEALELNLLFKTTGEFRIENSVVGLLVGAEGRLRGTGAMPAASGRVRSKPRHGEIRVGTGSVVRVESLDLVLPEEQGREASVRFEGRLGSGKDQITVLVAGPPDHAALTLLSDPPKSQRELLAVVSQKVALGTITSQLTPGITDEWPSADRKESFLSKIAPTVIPGEAPGQRRVPWELPAIGTARGTVVRTEYIYNRYFSIIAETDREADVSGDLKLRIRF